MSSLTFPICVDCRPEKGFDQTTSRHPLQIDPQIRRHYGPFTEGFQFDPIRPAKLNEFKYISFEFDRELMHESPMNTVLLRTKIAAFRAEGFGMAKKLVRTEMKDQCSTNLLQILWLAGTNLT
jgi:hypothetical protein